MSKTAIVKSGENFFIKQLSKSQPIKLDRVIFANVPGINSNTDVDANEQMPDASQIVHSAPVTQSGLLNDRTVVYSVILDTNVGDFSFNYIGLVNAETNTLCLVMHTDLTKKIKTAGQRQGNTITESIWLEMDNASESTGITVNAETWQIDYSKRLAGEDERIRLTNYDLYNRIAINTGLNITKLHNQLTVSPGIVYINGLRVQLSESIIVVVEHNQSLYVDAWLAGTTTGEWTVKFNLIAGANLRDYHDGNFQHYVERIASVDNVGNLIKVNPKSFVTTFDLASLSKVGIVKLSSAIDSTSETEAATPKAVKTVNDNANYAHARINDVHSYAVGVNNNVNYANNRISQVHDYSKEVDSRVYYVNDRVNIITDKFQTDNYESRVYSADKRVYMVIRNDGVIGMYSHVKNDFVWYVNHDGWMYGYITADRIGGLDQFVRDRTLPIGIPQPWPKSTPPNGWLKCNGWKFDTNKYPKLAMAYPSGYLPEMRGEFIRGWDDGRGIDPGREILSWQGDAIRNISGTFVGTAFTNSTCSGAFFAREQMDGHLALGHTGWKDRLNYTFDASRVVPVAHENRPRSIAFMYIVKAE
nr:phage tail protein [Gilliamella apicola]